MNSLTSLIKRRTAQTVVLASTLALAGIAQAQYGSDSAGSSSSSSTNSNSNSSGQSSQQQKSYDQSNAADKGKQSEELERRVKKAKERDQEHNLDPASIRP